MAQSFKGTGLEQSNLGPNIAGTGPVFSVYQTSVQNLPSNTPTKIQFAGKEFDTSNSFDSATNHRFQPNVAGYYYVSGCVTFGSTSASCWAQIYKNGVSFKRGDYSYQTPYSANASASCLVYLNGSTDYLEFWGSQISGGTVNTAAQAFDTYFQGFLARAA
jgi:hypothetical protein